MKNWLIWKDPDTGKDWGQEEKGTIGDEMVGWHHRLNGHGFGWTPGVGDGQGGLVATIHGVAKSQTWLSDWTELNRIYNSSKSTMNYDLFFLITVKQKWQFLMVDILVSFRLVVPLSVRASEFFFFSCRRQKRKEIICEKHIHSLESYSKWKWTHHFNSPMGGKKNPMATHRFKIPWTRKRQSTPCTLTWKTP